MAARQPGSDQDLAIENDLWPCFNPPLQLLYFRPTMSSNRVILDQCLWVYGEDIYTTLRNAKTEIDAVKERGAQTFMLRKGANAGDLDSLRHRIWRDDTHVILTRLHPGEMSNLKPIFRNRRNFSVCYDDWWIMPHWFTQNAEHVVFRKYNGVTVRLGKSKWANGSPPLMFNPFDPDSQSKYALTASALRFPILAISPIVNTVNIFRRRGEDTNPRRYLYFPFSVKADDLPLKTNLQYKYDFTNTWSVCGIFMMRDPFAPFHHTFANLYADRLKMTKLLVRSSYSVYHGRHREWNAYTDHIRQSRFAVATGGLCDKFNPNFLECACLGTPMIGRSVPWEAPWFDECLFPVDIQRLTPGNVKTVLEEALERHSALRNNCLNWRDRLFKMYDPMALLDMLQAQLDGHPIPPVYLKPKALAELN